MRYGLIDIGSNTIRAEVYEVEGKAFKRLISEKDFAGMLNYIENGQLTKQGITALCESLERLKQLCELLSCVKIHFFATASLRTVKNREEIQTVLEQRGLSVRILTGEEEAECDFYGLMAGGYNTNGAGFDLGGGSCQVFRFSQSKLQHSASLPLGSLLMYNRFVRGVIPTKKEQKEISDFAYEQLSAHNALRALGLRSLYAIGGTARAAAKLHRALTGQERPVDGYTLSCEQLEELCALMRDLNMKGLRLMEKVTPERITTMMPGLIVILCVCHFVGAREIQVVKKGVREGYLCRYMLQ